MMTRKRALELAMDAMIDKLNNIQKRKDQVGVETLKRLDAEYAELEQALNYVENMARQKTLDL